VPPGKNDPSCLRFAYTNTQIDIVDVRTTWSLRRVRDAQTNAILDVRLQCRTAEIQVPVKQDDFLGKSQLYIPYFSQYCAQIDSKHKPEAKTVSSSLEAGRAGTP
jgi:hypothetical protein